MPPATFIWSPGVALDVAALARMERHFPRPAIPMGEAWFMGGERAMFTELAAAPRREVPIELLVGAAGALDAIGSGIPCFGRLDEWVVWFRYLLPTLIRRSHERHIGYLVEPTITAFMNVYWDGVEEEYAGFARDVLATLGQCVMRAELWDARRRPIAGGAFDLEVHPNTYVAWGQTSADLSASIFFCLKYLPAAEVAGWAASLTEIDAPAYRMRLLAWLWGAWPLLVRERPDLRRSRHALIEEASPSIGWEGSHTLGPAADDPTAPPAPLVPDGNRSSFVAALRDRLTFERMLGWIDGLEEEPEIARAAAELGLVESVADQILR